MTKRNPNTFRSAGFRRTAPFAAGVLIGLSVVTPVFAATMDVERLQPLMLLGSLVVLLIGLALKAIASSPSSKRGETRKADASRDLRWMETGQSIDVALPLR